MAAADGQWRVDLDALEARAVPQDMTVRSGDETVLLTNVAVGEVWLCSGRSNMEWALEKAKVPRTLSLRQPMP